MSHVRDLDQWYKTCRPHLEWANWDPQGDFEAYTDRMVQRAQALGSDTLLYCWESGGYPVYPSRHAPPYAHLRGTDLLGMIREKARAAGLRFVICYLGLSGNTYLSEHRPDWVQCDRDGNLSPRWHGYQFRTLCPNSPFDKYLYDVTAEMLERYRPDGLYLEGVYVARGFCYCPHCQRRFRKRFGYTMRTPGVEATRDYETFRQESVLRPFAQLRRAIDDVAPGTVFFACTGTTYYRGSAGDNVARIAEEADVVCQEAQWNYDLPDGYKPGWAPTLPETGLVMRLMRAESGKPTLGTVWIGKHVDQNYAPRSEVNVVLNFQELLFQGSLVQVHTQNALEIEPRLLPTLARLYRDAAVVQPYLADAELVAHAAVLDWATLDEPADYFDDSLRGCYKALGEYHVPTRLTTATRLRAGHDRDCPVFVLPNVKQLDTDVVANLAARVEAGAGLVLTGRSILAHPDLAALAGVVHVRRVVKAAEDFPLHTYYRFEGDDPAWAGLTGTLLSFAGRHEEVEAGPDVQVVARILEFDTSRRSEQHILQTCYPAEPTTPLVTVRSVGKGRVVYLAADLCAAARRHGDPHILGTLAGAVRCATTAAVPLTTNCPPSVEIVLHRRETSLALCLLNQTTNQYLNDPIRYVVPLRDLELAVRLDRAPGAARTIAGGKLDWRYEGGCLHLALDRLAEYEAVLVDM